MDRSLSLFTLFAPALALAAVLTQTAGCVPPAAVRPSNSRTVIRSTIHGQMTETYTKRFDQIAVMVWTINPHRPFVRVGTLQADGTLQGASMVQMTAGPVGRFHSWTGSAVWTADSFQVGMTQGVDYPATDQAHWVMQDPTRGIVLQDTTFWNDALDGMTTRYVSWREAALRGWIECRTDGHLIPPDACARFKPDLTIRYHTGGKWTDRVPAMRTRQAAN